jgi:UDP:flavonoid glycosyltransferase YjiC (YdhE family)
MGRDQNDTAARVVHCGAGVRVKPTASVKTISRAIEQALHTPSHLQAAQRMAQAIASRQGCADAVDRLERLARRGGVGTAANALAGAI